MIKIKFIGENDDDFTKDKIYQLVSISEDNYYFYAYITNNENKISVIPYSSLFNFNMNWEVVNNER